MEHAEVGQVYRATRERITELVAGLSAGELDRTAPATPRWRVRDVVAHLAGNLADLVDGNLDGIATDAWTQAQVERRRSTPIGEVLDEWERHAGLVERLLDGLGPVRSMLVIDTVSHEHDLRHALGRPGERTSDAVALAFGALARGIGAQRMATGAGALRIVHEAGRTVVGDGQPAATVRTSRFEVVRAATGRRSAGQIVAWDWEGDPHPATVVLPMFAPGRADPLVET